METVHRVSINSINTKFIDYLNESGIEYKTQKLPGEGNKLYFFDIKESDPRWTIVLKMIKTYCASDVYQTVFTPDEIRNAEWLRIIPIFQRGYPQPEDTWSINPPNYENYCSQCGTFAQKDSFRIEREPPLENKSFFSLFWAYVIFCTPFVFRELSANAILGYEEWDVIIHLANKPSKILRQLYATNLTRPGLITVDLKQNICPLCKNIKYYPQKRGNMLIHRESMLSNLDIVQTYEWFGSGHAAFREILISNRLARLILEKGWQGVQLKVVELV